MNRRPQRPLSMIRDEETPSPALVLDEPTLARFKKVALSLISALCILRHEGIIHGDIKLENVFVDFVEDGPTSHSSTGGVFQPTSGLPSYSSRTTSSVFHSQHKRVVDRSLSSCGLVAADRLSSSSAKRLRTTDASPLDSSVAETKRAATILSSPLHQHVSPSAQHNTSAQAIGPGEGHAEPWWVPPTYSLRGLPLESQVLLGDFGNAIHVSEAKSYYSDFELQSLPYRAPEVLIGQPFGTQIDVWSVGVLLVELCIGQPLFVAKTREELCVQIGELIAPWPQQRFAGGRYSSLLRSLSTTHTVTTTTTGTTTSTATASGNIQSPIVPSSSSSSHVLPAASPMVAKSLNSMYSPADHISPIVLSATTPSPSQHLINIRKLFDKFGVRNVPDELIDFIGELLQLHPDTRMTPYDALQHPFLLNTHMYQLPVSLFHLDHVYGSQVQTQSNLQFVAKKKENAALASLGRLRKSFTGSSKSGLVPK